MSFAPQLDRPFFSTPVRWTLRALAWTAFAASAYLAWHAVNETHVAGCGVDGASGCDMVLSTSWSKWLGLPVALPGLACYATLAALSVLLGVRNPRASAWIHTAFVMLAGAAAVASLWFLALQVVAIGHYCRFCIVADLCGIAIGGITAWSAARWWQATRYRRSARGSATNLAALRSALPARPHNAPAAVHRPDAAPSLPIAVGGAVAIVALLVGGQILFPEPTHQTQQVALTESIDMDGTPTTEPGEPQPLDDADARIAMRIPADAAPADQVSFDDPAAESIAEPDSEVLAARYEEPLEELGADSERLASDGTTEPAANETPEAETDSEPQAAHDERPPPAPAPQRERIVKFLDGKLSLDVYKHPLIGSPEAPHVMVEMVSYNCPHCRATHRRMKQALSRYGDQIAVIVMVIPFERSCNKLIRDPTASHRGACSTARMALGVAALKPSAFARFHDWLMSDEDEPPPIDRIVARAYRTVNADRLRELSNGEQLKKQIEQYVNLFATLRNQNLGNKKFGLPIQILGDHVVTGAIEKPSEMHSAWEEHLGVKPPGRN